MEKEKTENTDKTTLNLSELDEILASAAEKAAQNVIDKVAKEKVEKTVEKEVEDTQKKVKVALVDNAEEKAKAAQKEADSKNWGSFGEMCTNIWKYRMGFTRIPDNRLTFVDKTGTPAVPKSFSQGELEQKVMTEGTDSSGGFLVPEIYRMEIQQIGLENAIVRKNKATVLPMATDTLNIPRVDDTSHASSVFGGVVAYWTAEGASMTATDIAWGQCTLSAKTLTGFTSATNELLQDNAVSLDVFLKRAFGEAIAYYEDDAFLTGSGAGRPLGISNCGALIQTTRQDTNNVLYNDLVNIYSRMLPTSRGKAVWLINHEVLPELMKMGAGNATQASGHNLVWISPDMGAAKGVPGTIFGRPFFVTEKLSAMGDAFDIAYLDFSYYLIGDRSKLSIDVSTHVYFTTNKIAWRFVKRLDGQPWPASAITPANGTATLSPFVTLSATS